MDGNEREAASRKKESANGQDGAFAEKGFKKILFSQKLILTCW